MRPERNSIRFLSITRSKAKMFEYDIPEQDHIVTSENFMKMLDLTIGIVGDIVYDFSSSNDIKNRIMFSAQYFDALSNIDNLEVESFYYDYLNVLGSVAYYLGDYPGSSNVLLTKINEDIELDANKLEYIIISLLSKKLMEAQNIEESIYKDFLEPFINKYNSFLKTGNDSSDLIELSNALKGEVYKYGSSRELLFADIINALIKKFLQISVWTTFPKFTDLEKNQWIDYLSDENCIKELWPSQILLGEKGVFKGESAVIQMPTSAGKTKSTELIIRSAFKNNRTNFVVIVAPFRSLCHEIYNEFLDKFKNEGNIHINLVSDVMQFDIEVEAEENQNYILILTPEKLDFLLRHKTEIAFGIGLIIYDEGHIFDDDSRGVKYELLLSFLKKSLPFSCQIILISAVMPNSKQIGEWLIGEEVNSVEAANLNPTQRNVAFVNWKSERAMLRFVEPLNINQEHFFVPKILESLPLNRKKRERKDRFFPNLGESSEIAMTLGCKLVKKGAVAVFTARKDSAIKCGRDIIDAFERDISLRPPSDFLNEQDLNRFYKYLSNIMGPDSVATMAAKYGILMHHRSIPEGVRISVEHALQTDLFRFVICTSTLSQGVNLPLRYLIITTTRQGKDAIKVRDFHNLIGRAGRSGKYTEGTIIFSDNGIYDRKSVDDYYWKRTQEMLDPSMSEKCNSRIIDIFKAEIEYASIEDYEKDQLKIRQTISEYLLKALEEINNKETAVEFVESLAKNTLAYYQAYDHQRSLIVDYFKELTEEIFDLVPEIEKRKVFSKAILPLEKALELYEYLVNLYEELINCREIADFEAFFWPIIYNFGSIPKNIPEDNFKRVFKQWIAGKNFGDISNSLHGKRLKSRRNVIVEHVVDLCEGTFGYESSLIIGSCMEIAKKDGRIQEEFEEKMILFQRMIKYGLPDGLSINLYEMGFADRFLALQVAEIIRGHVGRINKRSIISGIRQKSTEITSLIRDSFPTYFEEIIGRYLN